MPGEPVFLINTRTYWKEMPRARHQLARALAARHKVYFIEYNRVGPPGLAAETAENQLVVLTPSFPMDPRIRYRVPWLSRRYQRWLFPKLRDYLRAEGDAELFVVNFDHTATEIFDYFPNVMYFCNDDPLLQPGLLGWLLSPYFARTEKIVLRKSLFTVVVSDYLFRCKNAKHKYLLYLGAEPTFLDHPFASPPGGEITLNYMGFINYRLEARWIVRLARDFPSWKIELVGPIDRKTKRRLAGPSNISLIGLKRGEELRRFTERCQVGLLPFKNNRRMRTCSANNKYWQYLALGKPVVYRDLPDLIRVPEQLLYKASTYEEFRNQILRALREDCPEFRTQRRDFARENNWDRRAEELIGYFYRHLAEKQNRPR
ncbi:MAG: glycosyltransferase family protein [Candidatus Aminicenantales bacterium]